MNIILNTHDIITGIIFGLGLITVYLSVYSCVKFDRFRKGLSHQAHRLSRAVSLQLAGEAVIGIGTLAFATAEFMGWLVHWPYQVTSALRFTMFLATSLTTLHLVRVIDSKRR